MKNSNEKLNAIIRKGNKNLQEIEKFKAVSDNMVKSFYELSKVSKSEKRNRLKAVVENLKKGLISKSDSECLTYLFHLKEHYLDLMDQSKIDEDKHKRLFLQEVLSDIIEPKLDLYKEKVQSLEITGLSNLKSKAPIELDNSKHEELTIHPLPDGFCQISCSASKDEILNYFMILTKEKNSSNGEQFMSEEDVLELVENNFKIFNKTPTGKVFKINIKHRQKSTLTHFVYQFYEKYAAIDGYSKKDYVNFLLWNFINYKSDNPKSLASNMTLSNRPSAKNVIQIKPYLK
jgi:hypothetical protein